MPKALSIDPAGVEAGVLASLCCPLPVEVLTAVRAKIAGGASWEGLAGLLGQLVELEERTRLKLHGPAGEASPATPAAESPTVWLTPPQAAAIAKVPVKRIYEWARGQRWASRPTRRCLRIDEARFRAWLRNRA